MPYAVANVNGMGGSEQEGLRRTICDMTLLIFHLVLSSFTFEGVDIRMAQKILDYHIQRYPNGTSGLSAILTSPSSPVRTPSAARPWSRSMLLPVLPATCHAALDLVSREEHCGR